MMDAIDVQLGNFRQLDGGVPSWVAQRRADALARFTALGFPTTRLEDWKYTDVGALARTPFRLGAGGGTGVRDAVARAALAGSRLLVFVNGRYAPALSQPGRLPPGVVVGSLAAQLTSAAAVLEPHLGRFAADDSRSLAALNTAFIADGAVIYLPRGAALPEILQLLFVSSPAGAPSVSHPRTLIVAEADSQATVVESYVGGDGEVYWTNAVTEAAVGPHATLTHYRLQREGTAAFHTGSVSVRQAAGSRFRSHVVSTGGALVRTDVDTVLDAAGAACDLDGLYLVNGRQHVDHHTSIDHRQPQCTSRELYKGVLTGRAHAVFNGKVFVRPHAVQSDAAQVNKNLLLSDTAVVDTKPQLEIFADDVKCSHGATIGRLDEEAVFYLRSRGIAAHTARNLLIYAFAQELIARMHAEPVRAQLEGVLAAHFHDRLPAEAVS
jgi:Fe-S cluster assembly protein SufD